MVALDTNPKSISGGRLLAFSLVELLVVVVIIGLMTLLLGPAAQGMLGASRKKAGLNQLVNALEQTRMAAIENGVNAYLAIPPSDAPVDVRGAAFMILRDKKDGEDGSVASGALVPLTRWQRLPAGVVINKTSILDTTNNWEGLPKLQSQSQQLQSGNLQLIKFDRFGRVPDITPHTVNIQIGEGEMKDDGTVIWKGNLFQTIEIQRLTGRVVITGSP
jgi:type II secretory pathway pseudopilin PulG